MLKLNITNYRVTRNLKRVFSTKKSIIEHSIIIPNYKNNKFTIKHDGDWFINMTDLGKNLNKLWRTWKYNNKQTIAVFEVFEGKKLLKITGLKNRPTTYVGLVLALQALSDYDRVLSYHIFKYYEKSLLESNSASIKEITIFYLIAMDVMTCLNLVIVLLMLMVKGQKTTKHLYLI